MDFRRAQLGPNPFPQENLEQTGREGIEADIAEIPVSPGDYPLNYFIENAHKRPSQKCSQVYALIIHVMPEGSEEEQAENAVFYKMHRLFRILPEFEREINIGSGYEHKPEIVFDRSYFEPDIKNIENDGKRCTGSQEYGETEKGPSDVRRNKILYRAGEGNREENNQGAESYPHPGEPAHSLRERVHF